MSCKKYNYNCDCGSEMMVLEPEIEVIDDNKQLFFLNISIWLLGYNNSNSLFERLRHCWHILRTGNNYSDQIILSYDSAKQLSEDLSTIVNSYVEVDSSIEEEEEEEE